MMRNFCRTAGVLMAGAMAGAMTGCTASTEPTPATLEAFPAEASVSLTLPLDTYAMSQRDDLTVQRAAWRLIRQCVERFGGRYTLPESLLDQDLPPDIHNSGRYGLFDDRAAAERGYGAASTGDPPSWEEKTKGKGGWQPSAAELVLVRGAPQGGPVPKDRSGHPLPTGGCSGETSRRMSGEGGEPPDPQFVDVLGAQSHRTAENSPQVRAAMRGWSECMRKRGYSYRDIWQPNNRNWPEPAGPQEIATARADVACKAAVDLVDIWHTVESAEQERLIEKHAARLQSLRTHQRTVIRNSIHIITTGGRPGAEPS